MAITVNNNLSQETVQKLLDIVHPGSKPVAIDLAPGSYSNFTHIVTAHDRNNSIFRIVVRRYQVFGQYDRGKKARREFAALQWAFQSGIPAPQPLYLDDTGEMLGIPGIVTPYVKGVQIESPADPIAWARGLAETLAQIHAVPIDASPRNLLLDANDEATWFLHTGKVPAYMLAHPDGKRVWKAVKNGLPRLQPVPQTLVHVDYWPGNVLWDGERVSAVVDWEEAAIGDPAIDVAYCCMDITLKGLFEAADEFLHAYESAAVRPVVNLGFWKLAAAARPMAAPHGWIDGSPQKEYFSRFIAEALEIIDE